MPPDPILAVLAFVGVILYAAIGAVVATLSIRFFGTKEGVGRIKDGSFEGDTLTGFMWATVAWPGWLLVLAVVGIVIGLVAGPVWVAKHVGMYLAGAVEESS